jgi:heat shock protein HtpX
VVLILLAWLLSQVVKLALSRSRELLADAGSVELTKNPDAMISALRKIEGRGELPGATSAVMELCVDNPREGFADLFATHPSVDVRVRALVEYAGGHDPGPLALPSDTANEPESSPKTAGGDGPMPPPMPSGPWGRAGDSSGVFQGMSRDGKAIAQDAAQGPSRGPWADPAAGPRRRN